MNDYLNEKNYIGKRVKVKNTDKTQYIRDNVIGKNGIVTKQSGGSIGVTIDGISNKVSGYGVYWFEKNELKFLRDEREDNIMEGFKFVAIVNLVEDYNKKDYAFAIYEEDLDLMASVWDKDAIVVVNTRNGNQLAAVKEIMPVELYNGVKITAEVVGVVNMNNYIAREEEKKRLAELEKKKAAIEKELEAEISKRKSVEYYEEMAKKYSDNPKLAELVAELKGLGA